MVAALARILGIHFDEHIQQLLLSDRLSSQTQLPKPKHETLKMNRHFGVCEVGRQPSPRIHFQNLHLLGFEASVSDQDFLV